MRLLRKATHATYDLKYHLVFVTKYRYPVLRGRVALRVRELIRQVCAENEVAILRGVVSPRHVHLFVSAPPSLAPAKLVQYCKGLRSRKVQQEFPELRKRYWGQHFWARGYYAASSGNVTDEVILRYIEDHRDEEEAGDGFRVAG